MRGGESEIFNDEFSSGKGTNHGGSKTIQVSSSIIKFWSKYSVPERLLLHLVLFGPFWGCLILSFIGTYQQAEAHTGIFTFAPKCIFKTMTGHPCITCGLSRAFCAISHGQFAQAMQFHIFSAIWYLVFLLFAIFGVFSLCLSFQREGQTK
ncbi:MAG: DUF2752 domain-containing protein [Kiritimatiellaeota bacterium]|nr:DUF2752 domain-containing protein [Kiritimatiellota bacterium]